MDVIERTATASGSYRPRVLLWHWGREGAGSKFTYELARELRACDTEVTVSSVGESDLTRLVSGLDDVRISTIHTFRGDKFSRRGRLSAALGLAGLPRITWQFRRTVRDNDVEVAVCSFQSIWDAATLPVLAFGSVRFVLILHDAFFHPGDEYPFRHFVLRQQVRQADALIVLSEHVRRQAIAAFDFPADRVWLMPHAAFSFGDGQVGPVVHPRGSRKLRVLFFGKIVAYKGLGRLLRAHRILRERGTPVDLVIAGAGSLVPYQDLLDGSGVELQNRWLSDADIGELMSGCDVAVLPYDEASQSGVAAAAYAAGRPVVVTPIGGLPEQVGRNVTGLLARDMSDEAFADALTEFIVKPELLDQCGRGVLGYARDQLNWRRSALVVREAVEAVRVAPRRRAGQGGR